MFSLFSDPMKPDSTNSLSGKQNIRKGFRDEKTEQRREALVNAGQREESGIQSLDGTSLTLSLRWSTGRNPMKHLGTV